MRRAAAAEKDQPDALLEKLERLGDALADLIATLKSKD
jgi:hypothetical protein